MHAGSFPTSSSNNRASMATKHSNSKESYAGNPHTHPHLKQQNSFHAQARERGLSASALDQGRVAQQLRSKNDPRNYSVGVHKNVHGSANPNHFMGFSPNMPQQSSNGKMLLNQSSINGQSQNRARKTIKTMPVRSPKNLNQPVIQASKMAEAQQHLPEIRTHPLHSNQKTASSQ